MFFSKRVFFTSISLALFITTSGWLVVKSARDQISHGKLPPDFVENTLSGLIYQNYDQQGYLAYKLSAKSGERRYNQASTLMLVTLFVYDRTGKTNPWKITAKQADIINQNNGLYLHGNVVMERKAKGTKSPALKIATESVHYDDKKGRLYTDKLVVLSEPGTLNNTVGIGLNGYPKKGHFQFSKHVRSYYAGNTK